MTDLQSRSLSRGRDGFTSSGRGGLGNIRQTSSSRTRPESGPDDFSSTRGREHAVDTARVFSFGRGGAGNLRSPSREVSSHVGPDIKEQVVVENFVAAQRDTPHSTGRGGLGNITGRSRSRGPAPGGPALPVHSTGRGGAGNILQGDAVQADVADEVERRKAGAGVLVDEIRSTGRGGAANFTAAPEPAIERPPAVHHPNHPSSTGRGGAGNIVRE